MSLFVYLIIFTVILTVIYTFFTYRKFPPGPYGIPILGYLPFLTPNGAHLQITEMGKKYGNIFSINFGMIPIVILNNMEVIREAFVKQSDTFSGRPNLFFFNTMFEKKDIISSHGNVWKEQRKLTQQHLRNFGVGRSSIEVVIMNEVEKLIEKLQHCDNQQVVITELFTEPMLNVILGITAGENLDKTNNKEVMEFNEAFHNFAKVVVGVSILNYFPFLRFIMPNLTGYNEFLSNHQTVSKYIRNTINFHSDTFDKNHIRDFIDAYLSEIEKKTKENGLTTQPPYNKQHLAATFYNLILAGVESIDTTLSWAFLHIALRPGIQDKVQQELDSVLGKHSLPSASMRDRLPYTEATLLEIQRFCSIVPFSVPHSATVDTKLCGYDIPKGTWVMPNIWAVHHDPNAYPEPEIFRPERFLNKDGKCIKPENFIPFSIGSRLCIGDSLAKMELFLVFACLMQRFKFEIVSDKNKPSTEPITGASLRPQPYSLLVRCRH